MTIFQGQFRAQFPWQFQGSFCGNLSTNFGEDIRNNFEDNFRTVPGTILVTYDFRNEHLLVQFWKQFCSYLSFIVQPTL